MTLRISVRGGMKFGSTKYKITHCSPAEMDFLYKLSAYQLKRKEEWKVFYILASNTGRMSFQSYAPPLLHLTPQKKTKPKTENKPLHTVKVVG